MTFYHISPKIASIIFGEFIFYGICLSRTPCRQSKIIATAAIESIFWDEYSLTWDFLGGIILKNGGGD